MLGAAAVGIGAHEAARVRNVIGNLHAPTGGDSRGLQVAAPAQMSPLAPTLIAPTPVAPTPVAPTPPAPTPPTPTPTPTQTLVKCR